MPQKPLTPDQVTRSITGPAGLRPQEITHISYSGRNTLSECPKQYELSYVMGAPQRGAVWFVGGLAVHRATEEWDRAQVTGTKIDLPSVWRTVFNEELDKARERDPEILRWQKAGVKKDNERGEDIPHWFAVLGPSLVESYMAWRSRSAWEIWTTPDGEPAIELDIGGTLPGMDGVQFKGFLDRIFYDRRMDQLHLVDLKTGSRKPESGLQLGVYGAAVQHRYGIPIPFGAAFMNRHGTLAEPWGLAKYTPEYVGKHFKQVYDAIQAGYFPPKVTRSCSRCGVAAACYANDGPLSAQWDRDHPDNSPGF